MIRLAIEKDINEINNLLYQVHKVHSDARPDLFKVGSKKYTDEELKEIINDKEKPIFVYENDKKIEGYAFCILINHHNENSLCDYKSLYIDDLCVDKNCRGKGIGHSLYQFVLEYAKSIGCYNLTLNVWEGNEEAMRFYKNIGLKIQKIGMEKIL